jgi:UDP-GlcNAc:undecaprenyl-phosphate/decaprenyl-phosphate GlcNAc-1-phosphate transferase
MFTNYFLTPLLATVLLIAMLIPVALKTGFTDKPCHRKQHKNPTPIIGGLAIYLSLLITFLLADKPLPSQNAFLTAVTLLVGVGLIDDYKNLSVKIRLVIQIAAALIMAEVAHLKITSLGDVFGMGDLILNDGVATVFTVFAVVGGINAFNMIDGMDGLSGTLTLISIAAISEIAWVAENWVLFQYCLIFMGGIIGFLLFNMRIFGRPNAKIFLGDTGSTVFGFTVCWLAIGITQEETSIVPPIAALWLMGLPLIDSVCIMLRRISKGRSPFNPDREHLHHLFVVAGYSINFTLGLIAFIAATIVINGIAANVYMKIPESIMLGAFLCLFVAYFWLMNNAWTIMKISRYLRVTKLFDRRVVSQDSNVEMRKGPDRRFKPTPQQIESFHKGSGFFLSSLFKHNVQEKPSHIESKPGEDK